MSRARAARAGRIVRHRERAVDRVEAELGERVRRTLEARAAVEAARKVWDAAMASSEPQAVSSADLAETHAYRLSLARKVEVLLARERELRLEEDAARKTLSAAKTEMRKIEMWRDQLIEAAVMDENAQERRASDEVAARIARTNEHSSTARAGPRDDENFA